ncbi:glycosyltransferase [Spirulina major CS-329]|uniref:glycosyltransferase n=1 Tax=Spirulina TaxID=1154 RepID=UPI00232F575E|nr:MULTISPECIES: glycosyltransferase [Spirulina]MDB9493415.1 glycosyltransferase [Spirulina subsalsa CS-330]MDB9502407.1 glycosyltransferase [Spirulina major CS-329]
MKPAPRLMLFDLSVFGHHPSYMETLINYWHQQRLPGDLDFVVSSRFPEVHPETIALAQSLAPDRIHFHPITAAEEASLSPRTNGWTRAKRNFDEWQLLVNYCDRLQPDHCLILYFDTCILPLFFGKTAPVPVSGIYFRPTFHYRTFSGYIPSPKATVQEWREKILLSRVLRHPRLETLFSLDRYAVDGLNRFNPKTQIVPLADPVQPLPPSDLTRSQLLENLAIDPQRCVFLLFGALTSRKGIFPLLAALLQLSDQDCERITLIFAGEASVEDATVLQAKIAEVCAAKPMVQIVGDYRFLPFDELQGYLQSADVILAPYQRHVGMSGILVWAAMVQRPVLSSDYGLMGELVRRYRLGLAVDSTQPEAIAAGFRTFLNQDPNPVGDRDQMQAFADLNRADRFAATIFQTLGYACDRAGDSA